MKQWEARTSQGQRGAYPGAIPWLRRTTTGPEGRGASKALVERSAPAQEKSASGGHHKACRLDEASGHHDTASECRVGATVVRGHRRKAHRPQRKEKTAGSARKAETAAGEAGEAGGAGEAGEAREAGEERQERRGRRGQAQHGSRRGREAGAGGVTQTWSGLRGGEGHGDARERACLGSEHPPGCPPTGRTHSACVGRPRA